MTVSILSYSARLIFMIFPFDSTFFPSATKFAGLSLAQLKHQLMSLKAIDEDEERKVTQMDALAMEVGSF